MKRLTFLLFIMTSWIMSCEVFADRLREQDTSSAALSANRTTLNNEKAILSLSGSPLLFLSGGGVGTLTVTNRSTSVTATNVSATLPPELIDISQDASHCLKIPPKESCQLTFTSSQQKHNPIKIPIAGSNTETVFASLGGVMGWVTDESVEAVAYDAQKQIIYIGGFFKYVGPNTQGNRAKNH